MKIIIDENNKEDKYILQLGDLVESGYDDTLYLVTKLVTKQYNSSALKNSYILWSLDGDKGYNGYYDTLEQLTDSLVDGERIFKASEYELRLVRRSE